MSQSPIRLKAADALKLEEPTGLFECLYSPSDSVAGCFDGDAGHGNFVVQGSGPVVKFRGNEFDLRLQPWELEDLASPNPTFSAGRMSTAKSSAKSSHDYLGACGKVLI